MKTKNLLLTAIKFFAIFAIITNISQAEILEDLNLKTHINQSPKIRKNSNNNKENPIFYQKAFLKKLNNIVSYNYNKHDTYKVRLRPAISTIISLPRSEKIIYHTLGDQEIFHSSFNKEIPNILTINTIKENYDTNLVVTTNKGKIYNFYLRSLALNSKILPHFTVYINPTKEQKLLQKLKQNNYNINNITDLKQLNTSYSVKGDKQIAPIYVYDDGKFTYLDFGQNFISNRLPTIYAVIDKKDSLINNHINGNIIIVESLSIDGFTLKNGDKHVCVKPKISLKKVYPNFKSKKEDD